MRCLTAIAAAMFTGLAAAQPAGEPEPPPPPDNTRLIAMMPDQVDSILIYRYRELAAADPKTGGALEQLAFRVADDEAVKDIKAYMSAATARARPLVRAQGGSDFHLPPDLGLGNFNERAVTSVAESLAPAVRALVDGAAGLPAPAAMTVGAHTVYHAPVTIEFYGGKTEREHFYFCVVDERTLLTAEREDEIRAMLARVDALRAGEQAAVPERWKQMADHAAINSPLLVLRRFKDPENPVLAENAPKPPEAWHCAGYAVWLPEATSRCAKAVVHSPPGADNTLLLETMAFERASPIAGTAWTAAESCDGGQRMNLLILMPLLWFGTTPMI